MRKIVLGVVAGLMLCACVSVDCPVQNKVEAVYYLMSPGGGRDTLNSDTLSIWTHRADNTDVTLLNRLCGAKVQFSIPVSYTNPFDSLFVWLKDDEGNSWKDTICLYKENYPHFESVDCQASYFHKITAVKCSTNGIDSIVLRNTDVNYDNKNAHFYLYLKADR